jgi:hypothetical protein
MYRRIAVAVVFLAVFVAGGAGSTRSFAGALDESP